MYEFLHSVYPELYNLSAAFMFDFLLVHPGYALR
jgi:hypothetical protein